MENISTKNSSWKANLMLPRPTRCIKSTKSLVHFGLGKKSLVSTYTYSLKAH